MTRLEQQIADMQNKLNTLVDFSTEKHALFIADLNGKIIPILKKYKAGVVNPTENTYVDESVFDNRLYYRAYLKTDLSHLSKKKILNVEKAMIEVGVPIAFCGVRKDGIQLVYVP